MYIEKKIIYNPQTRSFGYYGKRDIYRDYARQTLMGRTLTHDEIKDDLKEYARRRIEEDQKKYRRFPLYNTITNKLAGKDRYVEGSIDEFIDGSIEEARELYGRK